MGIFSQGKLEKMYDAMGVWDIGQAVVTFQAFMDGPDGEISEGPAVDFQIGDRLTCLDYTFTWIELIEHNVSTSVDRLRYPAITVEVIVDEAGKRYHEGLHFNITSSGQIKWLTNERPPFQQDINRGGIYSIRYTARPVFFVTQMLHEVRATKGIDRTDGQLKAIRLPQQVLIRRDFLVNDDPGPRDNTTPPQ
jgi:hypothetical protein